MGKGMAAVAAWQGSDGDSAGDVGVPFEPLPLIRSERRLSLRAYHFWRTHLGDRALPRLDECGDLATAPFAGHMLMLDLPREEAPGAIRMVGAAFARDLGTEGQGAGERLIAELLRRLPALAFQRTPIGFEAELPSDVQGSAVVGIRGILLPFADKADRLAHVVGVMRWRHVAAEVPSTDIITALATVTGGADAPAMPAWQHEPASAGAKQDRGDLLEAAATWAALARADARRARSHLHMAIGLIHDAAAGLPCDELGISIEMVLGDLVAPEEREQLVGALSQARSIGLGGKRLATLLDIEGLAGFLAGPARIRAAMAEGRAPNLGFRLSPLDPAFLTPERAAGVARRFPSSRRRRIG